MFTEKIFTLNYIGNEDTDSPTWMRIMMGASEGDMSMFSSLNMQIAALNAGIDANIEWQWDGGHVPSEILGESLSLYVDEMYGKYVDGSVTFSLADAVSYRSAGASKAVPGFDVIDYGQEDYVFGDSDSDARHWDSYLLQVLEEHKDELSELFNQG